jgi:hypothetical protein
MKRAVIAGTTAALILALGISVAAAAPPSGAGVAALILAALATGPGQAAGAFETLAVDNQRIARALYDAQKATRAAHPPLSLDQIALRRQTGTGWGEIFNIMKSQGLLNGNTLMRILSAREHARVEATSR